MFNIDASVTFTILSINLQKNQKKQIIAYILKLILRSLYKQKSVKS